MGKALVLKGVNFSTNKLATVNFSGDIPCTGISLSSDSVSFDAIGGTETLTATPVPANTTDLISWQSSDANVATVANGVVTCTGVGTATITATCGNYSATCSVSYAGATYIQSDGSAYIQTDIVETADMLNYEAVISNDLAIADYTTSYAGNGHIFSAENIRYPFVKTTSTKFSLVQRNKGTDGTENTVNNYTAGAFMKITGDVDGTNFDVSCTSEDGTVTHRTGEYPIGSTYDTTKKFCILGYGGNPSAQQYRLVGKVKYIKVMNGTTPVHEFVAARKAVDGSFVYGLFDKVDSVFYEATAGTLTGS